MCKNGMTVQNACQMEAACKPKIAPVAGMMAKRVTICILARIEDFNDWQSSHLAEEL